MQNLIFGLEPQPEVDWEPHRKEGPGVYWRFESNFHWEGRRERELVGRIYVTRWWAWRETPCGVWIADEWTVPTPEALVKMDESRIAQLRGYSRLVLHAARRKWAYPTKEEAWTSFKARQSWRLIHARNALAYAEKANEMVSEFDRSRANG